MIKFRNACLGLVAVVAMVGLNQFNAYAHSNGPRTVSGDFNWDGNNCANAVRQVKRNLQNQLRQHCRSSHDSGSNALRNESFNKGMCIKTKGAGIITSIVIKNASYTAQCR